MDCRSAAHALTQIATLLELHGEDRFSVRAMQVAARAAAAAGDRALDDALSHGGIDTAEFSPAAIEVLNDLAESNGSALLERLQEETPEGLLEMLRVPGLGPARIRQIHDGLHIETLQELEQSARDGRLAELPRLATRRPRRSSRESLTFAQRVRTCSGSTGVPKPNACAAQSRHIPTCCRWRSLDRSGVAWNSCATSTW